MLSLHRVFHIGNHGGKLVLGCVQRVVGHRKLVLGAHNLNAERLNVILHALTKIILREQRPVRLSTGAQVSSSDCGEHTRTPCACAR